MVWVNFTIWERKVVIQWGGGGVCHHGVSQSSHFFYAFMFMLCFMFLQKFSYDSVMVYSLMMHSCIHLFIHLGGGLYATPGFVGCMRHITIDGQYKLPTGTRFSQNSMEFTRFDQICHLLSHFNRFMATLSH